MHTPPASLDGAKVIEYAIVDDSVKYTGALHLFHGETQVGPSAALAICKDPSIDGLLLFHCAEDWSVLGAQIEDEPPASTIRSLQQVKLKAERYYSGIGKRWVRK